MMAQTAQHGQLDPAWLDALRQRLLHLDFERHVEPLGAALRVAQYL